MAVRKAEELLDLAATATWMAWGEARCGGLQGPKGLGSLQSLDLSYLDLRTGRSLS